MSKFHAVSMLQIENAITMLQDAYFVLAERGDLDMKTREFRKPLSEGDRQILESLGIAWGHLVNSISLDPETRYDLHLSRKYEIAMFSRHEA